MNAKKFGGHIAALFTVTVWGTTFISSALLLNKGLSPAEIIIFRFLAAFLLLNIIYFPRQKFESVKREITYAFAGFCGVTLYYFLEIVALRYTKAANVSVILSSSPFFCGLFSFMSKKADKPKGGFFVGFLLAIAGIALVTFEDGFSFDINVKGALFALGSAVAWGIYSLLSNEIGSWGHNVIADTRRIFMYGLIFMIPTVFIFDITPEHIMLLADKNILLHLLYLSLLASGICFLTWNTATGSLGPVKTTSYVYASPLVTIIFSYFFLKDQKLTWQLFLGAALIIAGLILSVTVTTSAPSKKQNKKKKGTKKK